MPKSSKLSRRQMLAQGGAALVGMTVARSPLFARMFPPEEGEVLIPFLDEPERTERAVQRKLLDWQQLDSWITPNDQFFRVSHYDQPVIQERDWKLEITGLVKNPRSFTLAELKARPREEVTFTLECSGNHGFPTFVGAIGNARWAGTPLASILQEAAVQDRGIEVVFFGSDEGQEEIRENKVKQNFARSLSLEDAMNPGNLLCHQMNGEPLPQPHGYPVRLICPGWYGIANVKWLKRIHVMDTRFMGRFMGRDYVTLRQEIIGGEPVWTETSVGRYLLKSVAARVTKRGARYRIFGAAWGGSVEQVEVRIDEGPWKRVSIDQGREEEFAWKFWHLDWENAAPGEHSLTSRAIDRDGNVQPAVGDPRIATKKTYWESSGQITRRIRIS